MASSNHRIEELVDTMLEQDIEIFEAIAGDLLFSLGYERAFNKITPNVMEVSQRFQSWWDMKT